MEQKQNNAQEARTRYRNARRALRALGDERNVLTYTWIPRARTHFLNALETLYRNGQRAEARLLEYGNHHGWGHALEQLRTAPGTFGRMTRRQRPEKIDRAWRTGLQYIKQQERLEQVQQALPAATEQAVTTEMEWEQAREKEPSRQELKDQRNKIYVLSCTMSEQERAHLPPEGQILIRTLHQEHERARQREQEQEQGWEL